MPHDFYLFIILRIVITVTINIKGKKIKPDYDNVPTEYQTVI